MKRALAGVEVAQIEDDEYEPVLDMGAMRQAAIAQASKTGPVPKSSTTPAIATTLSRPEPCAVPDPPRAPPEKELQVELQEGELDSRLAHMLTKDTGKQAFTMNDDGHWVEGDGDFGAETGEVAGGNKEAPLAVMQQKEIARFKDLGATRGQFRRPETSWPNEVNELRVKMGEHRRQEAAEVMSHADEWQKRFEAENDQCHELALELEALEAQLSEPPAEANQYVRFQPLLCGEESFSPEAPRHSQRANTDAEARNPAKKGHRAVSMPHNEDE